MRANRRHGRARFSRATAILGLVDAAVIVAIGAHLAGGMASGASREADPLRLIGTQLGPTSCPHVPLSIGEGTYVVCPTWTAVLTPTGEVLVVSIYGPGNPVVDAYSGELPDGLRWNAPLASVWATMGRPNHITAVYGTPTLIYFVEDKPYGSLELRFDTDERLMRINASLVH